MSSSNREIHPTRRFELQPYIDECLKVQKVFGLSPRSQRELATHLASLRAFCQTSGVRDITAIGPDLLRAFLELHAPRGKTHLKLVVWTLRTFGAHLAVMQYLPDNPAKDLSHPVLRRRATVPPYLRPQELKAFLDTVVKHAGLRDAAVLMLMCNAGLRPREITLLQPRHVDIRRQVVAVTVKGGSLRLLPIAAVLAEALGEYLEERLGPRDTALFLNEWQRAIDVRWIERLVRRTARQAGIRRPVTPNTLRHTFATYMAADSGKAITRAYLGHGASSSTDTYVHLLPAIYRRYMNRHPFQVEPEPPDHGQRTHR